MLNNNIDLLNKVIHLQRGVKEVSQRDGIGTILDLRAERYFSLRHTFATHALTSGVGAYSHTTSDMQKAAANKVGSFIAQTV